MLDLPSERAERSSNRNERRHLTKRKHSDEDDEPNDSVRDQHRCWSTFGKRITCTQEESRADSASNLLTLESDQAMQML